MNITFDRDERKRQKEVLKSVYPEYDAKRHDSFVIRYTQEQESKAFNQYLKTRGVK